ncbi:hypothetical protein OG883_39905 [Streptomyces sp. NBC_01142]|uniref:hypothetical protein n=1 Tax=Streptomyces sp. NBC_01142 TaxID=2975865 RepID=UPI002252EC2E|nr:hypothetical protein [Streptomyces sp. NBC_01142]MCX4825872.1 hypothetical protein [Streptomyces sp. NBC_01142]
MVTCTAAMAVQGMLLTAKPINSAAIRVRHALVIVTGGGNVSPVVGWKHPLAYVYVS